MKRKILLVGGAGFIGHNLAVFLKEKTRCYCSRQLR